MKEVRCSITYAVFTRWDSFRKDNSDTDAKERKKDYATDFRNAVPKDGDVFFVDSISIKNKVKQEPITRSEQFPKFMSRRFHRPVFFFFMERFWREIRSFETHKPVKNGI